MKLRPLYIFCIAVVVILVSSCENEKIYLPKPRMYPKIVYPERAYQEFDTSFCQMEFQYPKYASFEQDKFFFDGRPPDPCWFNIHFDGLNGTLFCSYIPIKNRAHFDTLIDQSFELVEKHNIKANYRKEERFTNAVGTSGLIFYLGGEVATNLQYVLSDTTDHFFRASLYFDAKVAPDSIRPIYSFVKEDVEHMINTFRWK